MRLLSLIVLVLAIVVANPVPATAAGASKATSLAGSAAPTLRLGSRGPAVRALQSRLAHLTYFPSKAADGVFGMRTWHALLPSKAGTR